MLNTPRLEKRDAQTYVAIKRAVPMERIPIELPPLIPKILKWVEDNNIAQSGPAFFRYMRWTENKLLEVEVGVPVSHQINTGGEVIAGSFPAGTYLVATHTGNFSGLKQSHMDLEAWATKNNIKTKDESTPAGHSYGGRTEFYPMDPDDEPNPDKWIAELAFLVE